MLIVAIGISDFAPVIGVWITLSSSTLPSAPSDVPTTSAADAPPIAMPPNATATNALLATRDEPFDFERAVSSAAAHVPVVAFQTVR
ncbi:hypothetical protein WT27_04170 [Burkholderia territorii]|uniref:Uncharacterized protein n=1 Tax=Burkholderia territorii TaxID=1503055 RepID=A0A119DPV7_9BURK|nr:hypothetical protein WT27_04170 [Burkholderia territorii]KVX41350.1 hypothetical protein WT31_29610 [Burkholderia territorii]